MITIEAIVYLLIFGLSIIWSLLALDRKSAILSLLATLCWFILTPAHLVVAWDSGFFMISFLYLGFAFVFLVLTFVWTIQNAWLSKRERDWELI